MATVSQMATPTLRLEYPGSGSLMQTIQGIVTSDVKDSLHFRLSNYPVTISLTPPAINKICAEQDDTVGSVDISVVLRSSRITPLFTVNVNFFSRVAFDRLQGKSLAEYKVKELEYTEEGSSGSFIPDIFSERTLERRQFIDSADAVVSFEAKYLIGPTTGTAIDETHCFTAKSVESDELPDHLFLGMDVDKNNAWVLELYQRKEKKKEADPFNWDAIKQEIDVLDAKEKNEVKVAPVLEKDVPDEFVCPITQEMMKDPVIADDEHTYERSAITVWVEKHGTSPMTRGPMEKKFLLNRALKNQIERFNSASQQ